MPEVFEDLECFLCGHKSFTGVKSRKDGYVKLTCRQCGHRNETYYDSRAIVGMLIDSLKNPSPVAQ